jgi:hypothetical protein
MGKRVEQKELLEREFYAGYLCALAVIYEYRADAIYEEAVRAVDRTKLLAEARRTNNMRWSGLSRYERRRKLGEAMTVCPDLLSKGAENET